jgi:hypothetical protein
MTMKNSKTIDRLIKRLKADIKQYQQLADKYDQAPEDVHRHLVYDGKLSYAKEILALVEVSLESEGVV